MEIIMENNQINNYRYERKYVLKRKNLHSFLKDLYSKNYYEIYFMRKVNNLYYDNFNFSSLNDNIDGLSKRTKTRVRWYGEAFKKSTKKIEFKKKKEFVNIKNKIEIGEITLDSYLDISNFNIKILDALKAKKEDIKFNLNSKTPVLLNSYFRRYFTDITNKIRITIDLDLESYSPKTNLKSFENDVIIEVKYEKNNVFQNNFRNLKLTRNSKYAKGIIQTNIFNPIY